MRRRALLAALATSATAATAGCTVGYRPGSSASGAEGGRRARAGTTAPGGGDDTVAESGIPSTICEEPPRATDILAIDEPAFAADWSGIDADRVYRPDDGPGLTEDAVVVGLTGAGEARAYPLDVLWEHEIVNDRLGGPVLVTYCPLCRSGLVATRRVGGEPTRFQVSGLLWKPPGVYAGQSAADDRTFGVDGTGATAIGRNGNLVMVDDRTGSYWSQLLARAICGPETGTVLGIRPSTVSTWGEWRREHPETEVLLPPPQSGTVG